MVCDGSESKPLPIILDTAATPGTLGSSLLPKELWLNFPFYFNNQVHRAHTENWKQEACSPKAVGVTMWFQLKIFLENLPWQNNGLNSWWIREVRPRYPLRQHSYPSSSMCSPCPSPLTLTQFVFISQNVLCSTDSQTQFNEPSEG